MKILWKDPPELSSFTSDDMALVTESAATSKSCLNERTLLAELPGCWPKAWRTSPKIYESNDVESCGGLQILITVQLMITIINKSKYHHQACKSEMYRMESRTWRTNFFFFSIGNAYRILPNKRTGC